MRTPLSYQVKGFKRAIIYSVIGLVLLATCILTGKYHLEFPHVTSSGPTLVQVLSGFFAAIAFISAISEAFFVLDFTYFKPVLEFDDHSLYITRKGEQQEISFSNILSLRLGGSSGNGIRGNYSVYLIRYQLGDRENETEVTIFYRNRRALWQFQKALQTANPSAEIKNTWTSLDGLFRWFRKRRDN